MKRRAESGAETKVIETNGEENQTEERQEKRKQETGMEYNRKKGKETKGLRMEKCNGWIKKVNRRRRLEEIE